MTNEEVEELAQSIYRRDGFLSILGAREYFIGEIIDSCWDPSSQDGFLANTVWRVLGKSTRAENEAQTGATQLYLYEREHYYRIVAVD